MRDILATAALLIASIASPTSLYGQTTLFQEDFEDSKFTSRGWYDAQGAGGAISALEHIAGSTGSFECNFVAGATGCSSGTPMRHKFSDTDSVYVSYWVKHSANWVGSGKSYHPHLVYLLTNLNTDYSGLAYTYLTLYIEENSGYPFVNIQDGQNIDESNIGVNLIGITENRATAGCNGTQAGIGQFGVDCYLNGSVHWNAIYWRGPSAVYYDAAQKNDWHFVETYAKLNSVVNGIGQPDGVIQQWYDGQLIIDHSNVIIRTGQRATMKFNKLVLSPYIAVPGNSPINQSIWYDSLYVATSRPATTQAPSAPTNLRSQ